MAYNRQYHIEYYANNRARIRRAQNTRTSQWRIDALMHYSGGNMACECCRECRTEFLCLDHIHGGGNQDRIAQRKRGTNYFKQLQRDGWPSGFRVLCHNCNMSLGFYGYCPHGTQPWNAEGQCQTL